MERETTKARQEEAGRRNPPCYPFRNQEGQGQAMTDSTIQYKSPTYITGSVGFESGKPVPVVLPEVEEALPQPAHDGLEAFSRLISWLLSREDPKRDIQVLAYLFRLGGAAQDVAELAERIGVSRRQAQNIITASRESPHLSNLFTEKLDDVSQSPF